MSGKELAKFALSKLGVPYVYGAKGANGTFTLANLLYLAARYLNIFTNGYVSKAKKFVGKVCCDCSGLISWYTGKSIGSAQLYATASKRYSIKDIGKAPVGAVLWRSGHVGVYIGNGYCVEERGIAYGCVKSKVADRTFTHYLLFDYMDYESIDTASKSTSKANNPYKEPTSVVKRGSTGQDVKWVQWELREAGYTKVKVKGITKALKINGDFGEISEVATELFQASCKIGVDGCVGPDTRKKMKND